jgi:Dolichyl-phosphate-mannose-protein mannosyltransferase
MVNRFWQSVGRHWAIPVGGALLAILPVLQLTSLRHKELTYDEPTHYQYGCRVSEGLPRRISAENIYGMNSSTMPFSSLHVMTSECLAVLDNMLNVSVDRSWNGQIKRGRYATIVLSILLAVYVAGWSYELYGRKGALLSLSLFVFDPNLLAHGQLVTADLPAALMTTVALYHFWQFLKFGGKGRALVSAVTLGLSQLARYSCIYLYPIFLVIAVLYRPCRPRTETAGSAPRQRVGQALRRWSITTALFAGVSVLIINLGFVFDGIGTPLSGYAFKDPFFKRLQATSALRNIPLPLAVPYLQGLDLIKYQERRGHAWGNLYMAGTLRVNHHDGTLRGFPGYYFYAALFKVPIAKQVIFFVALLGFLFQHRQQPAILRRDELPLLVPICVYWAYFNFFFNTQIGIRHVLPVFVLVTVFCGRLLADPVSKRLQFTALMLTIWAALSTLSYYPHFLSYFNEFVPDRKFAYRYLADSNLDWGGNEWYLAEYIRRHPGVVVDPGKPQTGRLVVPVNILVGIGNPERYRWLREHFTPVDHIAYSFLVYDVQKEMLPQAAPDRKSQTESLSPPPRQ